MTAVLFGSPEARTGVVATFDDPRGLGTVAQDGGPTYDFHCTAIADGSRHVDVGAEVMFVVKAGHLGRLEAWALRPLGSVSTDAHPSEDAPS